MAKAAKITICEVEELVDALPPDQIHLPGIYVDRILVGCNYEKRIEKLALSDDQGNPITINQTKKGQRKAATTSDEDDSAKERRLRIVRRAAKEFRDGMYVNLGRIVTMLQLPWVKL